MSALPTVTCPRCSGTGEVPTTGSPKNKPTTTCPLCLGKGKLWAQKAA